MRDDTAKLEEALDKTKVVAWEKPEIFFPYCPSHIEEVVERLLKKRNAKFSGACTDMFILASDQTFKVSLGPGLSFKSLSSEHVELVNSKWPHKFPGSLGYMELLINSGCGFGLFKQEELVSWIFIAESGHFVHLYTLEGNLKKGYAEQVLKLTTNLRFKEKKEAFGFVVRNNYKSLNLFKKLGFETNGYVKWILKSDSIVI